MPWQTASQEIEAAWTTGAGLYWYHVAIISLLIAFFSVALAYMGAVAFNLPDMKRWAKGEFIQAGASAMLVFGLIVFATFVVDKVSDITLGIAQQNPYLKDLDPSLVDKSNPFSIAHLYINSTIVCLREYYISAFKWDAWLVEPFATTSITTVLGIHAFSGWPAMFFVNILHNITKSATWLLIANYFQRHLLLFIEQTMLTIFLPLGVTLRILPATRGAGSLLMGIAIGMYAVYPFSYALITSVAAQHNTLSCLQEYTAQLEEQCPTETGVLKMSHAFKKTWQGIKKWADEVQGRAMTFFFLQAFLYPFMALTISFTFAKQLSDMLGANVAELSQGLVRLI